MSEKGKILVVDDNPMNQQLVAHQLRRIGFDQVAIAASGTDALAWLEHNACTLVLADCQMPGMDGYEMTRHIRASERASGSRLPIIALSASAMEEDRQRCLQAGMDEHLAKPVQLATLRAALAHWRRPDD